MALQMTTPRASRGLVNFGGRRCAGAPTAGGIGRMPAPKLNGGLRSRARDAFVVRCDEGAAASVKVPVGVAGDVTDATWEEVVLKSPVPVVVDFWAPWCGPCRMIAPLIDELAADYGEKIRCVKMNTDESPTTATEYGIRSIPTVIVFKDGKKMDTVIGAVPKSNLEKTIARFVD